LEVSSGSGHRRYGRALVKPGVVLVLLFALKHSLAFLLSTCKFLARVAEGALLSDILAGWIGGGGGIFFRKTGARSMQTVQVDRWKSTMPKPQARGKGVFF
jgi:hypothetical protein